MYQETTRVRWNRQVGPSHFRIGLACNPGYGASVPGQFVMLRFVDQTTPLLRRPYSIHRVIAEKNATTGIELLYKVVGEGTRALSLVGSGDALDILGPLGRGFTLKDTDRRIVIAAGGIGIAPMVFLAEYLKQKNRDLSHVSLFLGGRSKADILCKDEFSDLGVSVCTTTDDGTEGDQCLVTSPLEMEVERHRPDIIYACGPLAMLKCVIGIAETRSIPCEISVETAMACGIGVCLGCAVETRDLNSADTSGTPGVSGAIGKYLHACLDGPVFNTREITL